MQDDKEQVNAVSIWDSPEVKEVESEGGGQGWISNAKIVFGYKCFVTGASNEDTFFAFDVASPNSKDVARKSAGEFAKAHGAKSPTAAIAVVLPKDETYLYDTSRWQGDRWWVIPTYTKAYEEILKPSLKTAGVALGSQWVRVGLKPDPFKPVRKSINPLTGEETENANLVPYIMEKFASKEEAMLAASSNAKPEMPGISSGKQVQDKPAEAEKQSPDVPEGWTQESWSFVVPDIKAMAKEGRKPVDIAKDFDIPVNFVVRALSL